MIFVVVGFVVFLYHSLSFILKSCVLFFASAKIFALLLFVCREVREMADWLIKSNEKPNKS
jgi:hypothetical protein